MKPAKAIFLVCIQSTPKLPRYLSHLQNILIELNKEKTADRNKLELELRVKSSNPNILYTRRLEITYRLLKWPVSRYLPGYQI